MIIIKKCFDMLYERVYITAHRKTNHKLDRKSDKKTEKEHRQTNSNHHVIESIFAIVDFQLSLPMERPPRLDL
jgi:hypothetical protein